jgi:hypothetical protein
MKDDTGESSIRFNIKINLGQQDYQRLTTEAALVELSLSTLVRRYALLYLTLLDEVRSASDGQLTPGSLLHTQLLAMETQQANSSNRIEQMLLEQRIELRTLLQVVSAAIKLWFAHMQELPPECTALAEARFQQFLAHIVGSHQQEVMQDMYKLISSKLIEGGK